ncbi:Tetratricopeptide-like helical domain superfamily [Sesbania bispinosa]|nr:Tetratricopeptide-like helical domain superfamily [Sesbania bispinosa]
MAEEDVTVLENDVGRARLWRSYWVRLNQVVQQQLNLEQVKTRAISLFKTISRILEDFDAYARTNTKLQDILSHYSMVNLELFNIVDEIKKVSKAFVVHPKNVNAENDSIIPVMLSSKLLPEMEMDDASKRDQLLQEMQNLPIATQIELNTVIIMYVKCGSLDYARELFEEMPKNNLKAMATKFSMLLQNPPPWLHITAPPNFNATTAYTSLFQDL